MKILHVYAKNLQVFVDAVSGTECKLNASKDIKYMLSSLTQFNARDILGLVVWSTPMTKRCVELVHQFDQFFVFKKLPIVIISDDVEELWDAGYFKVKNSKVFLLKSEDDSISDLDVSSIFTTILAFNDSVYDLSVCPAEHAGGNQTGVRRRKELVMSGQLSELLQSLKEVSADEVSGTEVSCEGEEKESEG